MNDKFQLGQAQIDRIDLRASASRIIDAAKQRRLAFVVTPNSDHIVMLERDQKLQAVYAKAFLVIADGMPLVWASRLLGKSLPERVTGSDLMPLLCEMAAKEGLRLFLLGAGPGIAEQAKQNLEKLYPGLLIVGTHSPPMGFDKNPEASHAIETLLKAAAPDIIFVGLGAPKQEFWIFDNYERFSHGIFLGIGASIDFCAGVVKRAPLWMQKTGLEWVYRLSQEPKRLAKRYAKDTYVLWIICREYFRR